MAKEKVKVEIGSEGLSLADIEVGELGPAYFRNYGRVEVKALEKIRKYREIIVVEANNEVVERVVKTVS